MSAFAAQLIETYTGVELRYNYRRFQREHLISSNERQSRCKSADSRGSRERED